MLSTTLPPKKRQVALSFFWCRRWDLLRFAKLHFATMLPTCGCGSLSCRPLKTVHRKVFFTGRSSPFTLTKKRQVVLSFFLVPKVGLEPTRYRYQRILSPSRLPFHHFGFCPNIISQRFCDCNYFFIFPLLFLKGIF